MKKFFKIFFVAAIFLILASGTSFGKSNTILIKLKDRPVQLNKTDGRSVKTTGIASIDKVLADKNVRMIPFVTNDLESSSSFQSLQKWLICSLSEQTDSDEIIQSLKDNENIQYIGENRAFQLHFAPNDTRYSEQWALTKIHAEAAWDIERGSENVIVSVIDTGIDYNHVDLFENIWINPGEDINGNGVVDESDMNGIDDDANGFVDDVQGWDFTDAPNYADGGDYLEPDNDPMDEYGHGTGVAGIITAMTGNNAGIAGVAHGCRVMNLRAFTAGGNGEEDDVAMAILYAIQNGADVINMSWGDVFVSRIVDDVIHYAATKNVVLVASAGNSSTEQIHYPSGFNGVISVGATDEDDDLAGFSNYGTTIDLVAPGVDILTTTLNDEYTTMNGTSFSAPFVSAAAALLRSQNKDYTAEQIRGRLVQSAYKIDDNMWDFYYGAGRLDLELLLKSTDYSIVKIVKPVLDQGFSSGPVVIQGSAWSPFLDNYTLYYGEGENPLNWDKITGPYTEPVIDGELGTWTDLPQEEGEYTVRLKVENRDGSVVEDLTRVFIDHSGPVISDVTIAPMLDGDRTSNLVSFVTDDLCEGSVFFRPQNSTEDFQEAAMAYRSNELRYNLTQDEITGMAEIKVRAGNGAGLETTDDNNSVFYMVDLSAPPIDVVGFSPFASGLPFGTLVNQHFDFNQNGIPDIVIGIEGENGIGPVKIFEHNGSGFDELYASASSLIPRDFGDIDNDGKPEMLCGLGFSSYLFKCDETDGFPSVEWKTWSGEGSTQYWAGRIADLDKDDKGEIIFRIVKSENNSSVDQFEIWELVSNSQFQMAAELPNPTSGENQNGVPFCEYGDFDNDGYLEFLAGDSDGDLYIYENTGDNAYQMTWQTSLPLQDAIDFLSVGDYDGDGQTEFIAGCHSDPNLNTEHYYDARHWYYAVFDRTGDNIYEIVADWRIFGFESVKDFESGVSSGDIDQDGDDEIFICTFPDFYIINYIDGQYKVIYHHSTVQSSGVLVQDVDVDGQNEILSGDGTNTIVFEQSGGETGLSAPVGVTAQPLDEEHVKISWREVSGADAYTVFKGTHADTLLPLLTVSENSCLDSLVLKNKTYYYQIIASQTTGGKTSLPSVIVSARPGYRPWLAQAYTETTNNLRLVFSEPLGASAKDPTKYIVNNTIGRPSSAIPDKYGQEIVLSFANSFKAGVAYTVSCFNVQDRDRTPLDESRNTADFQYTVPLSVPYLKAGNLLDNTTVELTFSETMDQQSVEHIGNYDFEDIEIVSVQLTADDKVELKLAAGQNFGAFGKTFTLKVKNLKSAQNVAMVAGRGDYLKLIFSQTSLDHVFTFPNPYKPEYGTGVITFANLTPQAEIRILTSQGRPVRTIRETNGDGGVQWDLCNDAGEQVASGIYIYRITYKDQDFLGKLAILK